MSLENNKLIDEFLESKGEYISHKDMWGGEVWGSYQPNRYDSDWNVLMSAVQYIDNLRTLSSLEESYLYCVELYGDFARIFDGKTGDVVIEIINGGSWIKTTYKLIVEFVKWYNLNK